MISDDGCRVGATKAMTARQADVLRTLHTGKGQLWQYQNVQRMKILWVCLCQHRVRPVQVVVDIAGLRGELEASDSHPVHDRCGVPMTSKDRVSRITDSVLLPADSPHLRHPRGPRARDGCDFRAVKASSIEAMSTMHFHES